MLKKIYSVLGILAFILAPLSGLIPTVVSAATDVATNTATNISSTDATLNATNGDTAADQASFWVSQNSFDTTTSDIPVNVYSTPVLTGIAADAAFSDPLSLVTTNGITTGGVPGNMPAITPNTTYHYVAWSMYGGTWHHGDDTTVTTLAAAPTGPTIPTCSGTSTFDNFTNGSVNGQHSWSATGAYDQAIVDNTYGYPTFGCKSLRISDSFTSGSFGDQTFAEPLADSVGETSATNGTFSAGTKKNHFEMQFDIASVLSSLQTGMHLSVSPDRGDGSRMSYLRFEDQSDGIHVFFDDVTSTTPNTTVTFNETDIATISRSAHTIKLTMDTIDGPSNDVVKVYIDGALIKTGTSWENYYRFDPESSSEQTPRIVKTVEFRESGTAAPADLGKGFLIDNLSLSASNIATIGPVFNDTNHDHILNGSETSYPTIQAAVDAAASGDWIQATAGTYTENVTINKSLTLNGAQVGVDARTRSGAESVINGGTAATITVTADNVTVDGFSLNGPVSSGTADLVMQTANTGETIKNNIFNNPGRAASITTSNTTFTQNKVVNTFATATDGFQANSTPISSLTISNNSFSGANGANYNADITVIEGTSNVIISGNSATGDGTLIALFKTNGAQITNNTIVGDGASSAIYIGGGDSNVTVSGNDVSTAGSAVNIANIFSDGVNSTVSITMNKLHGNTRGINIGSPAISVAGTITANRNALTGNSAFGFDNESSFNADATCNWWNAADGPGPVGPGSGDKVTTNATASTWLTTSDLTSPCNGPLPVTPTHVHVTIAKFIDTAHATAVNANSATFTMQADYNFTNEAFPTGIVGSDPYTISTDSTQTGTAYEAKTLEFYTGANYATHEHLDAVTGTSCDAGTPFALVGYSVGDTYDAAVAATVSPDGPTFTNLQKNEFVIVHNKACPVAPTTAKVHILKYLDGVEATATSASNYQFPMSATWNATNIGGGTGSYVLGASFGGSSHVYGADTAAMTTPYDYITSETTDTAGSQVVSTPETCAAGKYLLTGYKTSSQSFADAATQPLEAIAHQFSAATTDEYVIVYNTKCATTGSLTITKNAIGGNGTFTFTGTGGIGSFSLTTANNTASQTFSNLAPGSYTITEGTLPKGWTQTDSDCSAVVVTAGGAATCSITNTNNKLLGAIFGSKIEDRDGDGKLKDGDHHRLSGWTIYLDTNHNNTLDAGEPTSVTNAWGQYHFVGLVAGTYDVREVGQAGWIQTVPTSGEYNITLTAGQIAKKKDFGNFHYGAISGMKYEDKNGNGRKDGNESGLSGWTITLKGPNNQTQSTVTGADGSYSFTNLTSGVYSLSETMKTGWYQTDHPNKVKIQSGTVSTKNYFGNKQNPTVIPHTPIGGHH